MANILGVVDENAETQEKIRLIDVKKWCTIGEAKGVVRMSGEKEEEIGYRIMSLRMNKGYTREFLAELSGISTKFLYEIELKSKGFSAKTLANIAAALDVSLDYIMTGNDYRKMDDRLVSIIKKFDMKSLENVKSLLEAAYQLIDKD